MSNKKTENVQLHDLHTGLFNIGHQASAAEVNNIP